MNTMEEISVKLKFTFENSPIFPLRVGAHCGTIIRTALYYIK